MDSLRYILKRQKTFQEKFFDPKALIIPDKIKWTKEFVLCIHQELAEIMNTMDWKTYHSYDKKYNEEHTKEEIIDCFKFILNLMIVWGIDDIELISRFNRKSDEVEKRLKLKDNATGKDLS